MDLLKVGFIGSVDDGKSTLIGRIFLDSDSLLDDQRADLQASSERRGETRMNLALLTDGLRAEREQGITIDVAYRYFRSENRKYIVVDCPGHFQYTRNMITGCSLVDAVVILVDAQAGIAEQTKRHLAIASLLNVKHFILCVNKMDLVGFSESVFAGIRDELTKLAGRLGLLQIHAVPISALEGDNVVTRSSSMPWYSGNTVFELFETLAPEIGAATDGTAFRFPVQRVVRPNSEAYPGFRGYAGRIQSGKVSVGDSVQVSKDLTATVAGIHSLDEPSMTEAIAPASVVLSLKEDLDISRGDLISSGELPILARSVEVDLVWLSSVKASFSTAYEMKHTSRTVQARLEPVQFKVSVESLEKKTVDGGVDLTLNEMARLRMKLSQPLAFDPFRVNKTTGGFLLIDPGSNQTVAVGLIVG